MASLFLKSAAIRKEGSSRFQMQISNRYLQPGQSAGGRIFSPSGSQCRPGTVEYFREFVIPENISSMRAWKCRQSRRLVWSEHLCIFLRNTIEARVNVDIIAVLVGLFASRKKRSGVMWFLLSFVITPLIAFIILLVLGLRKREG